MTATAPSPLEAFHWERQPAAETLLRQWTGDFLAKNAYARDLAAHMQTDTGTRFFDWIDSFLFPTTSDREQQLTSVGYAHTHTEGTHRIFEHPEGMFPRIILTPGGPTRVRLKIDSVADFLALRSLPIDIQGDPFAPMRLATISTENNTALEVVERRGSAGVTPPSSDPAHSVAATTFLGQCRRRPRDFDNEPEAYRSLNALIDSGLAALGPDHTCTLFFEAEREYWHRRNRAAQVQKARQDRLGLGWGNHDHHTYRSSRSCFHLLIAFFEKLGLVCRERFYAGKEAGWGAQILENPTAGIITFNDVDLAPEEVLHDFAHNPLPPRDKLGTIGLWCGLHGEAMFQAGMHHLECQFDFDALRDQLAKENVGVMKPFTDFPHLRQAFTEGERWKVAEPRIGRLLSRNLITHEQAQQFRTQGALGSHLENLERNEGFKGFNQKGISEIISATDPRRHVEAART